MCLTVVSVLPSLCVWLWCLCCHLYVSDCGVWEGQTQQHAWASSEQSHLHERIWAKPIIRYYLTTSLTNTSTSLSHTRAHTHTHTHTHRAPHTQTHTGVLTHTHTAPAHLQHCVGYSDCGLREKLEGIVCSLTHTLQPHKTHAHSYTHLLTANTPPSEANTINHTTAPNHSRGPEGTRLQNPFTIRAC